MRNSVANKIYSCLLHRGARRFCSSFTIFHHIHDPPSSPSLYGILDASISPKPASYFAPVNPSRHLHATSSVKNESTHDRVDASDDSNGEVEPIDSWEEEDEAEPEVGDGGDGGGVVLNGCAWGERALSIAQEILQDFSEDMELFAFKTSPQGYIYVRLDKLSNEYGCPSMEEIESFSRQYKKTLDEELPHDSALEVSSPGADRLLKVPADLLRFKDMPMIVNYLEDSAPEKEVVYHLDSIEADSNSCIWKLADVRENRDPSAKGRPLNRKQRDCRVKLPYDTITRVKLYIGY